MTIGISCRILRYRKTDKAIKARRPDLLVLDEGQKMCEIADFARVEQHQEEKLDKYPDLARVNWAFCR